MRRVMTLVIEGNMSEALESVLRHGITSATAVTQKTTMRRCKTRVRVDEDRFGPQLQKWMEEGPPGKIERGDLLRAISWRAGATVVQFAARPGASAPNHKR